nr:hypothetical protein [uncultured Ruminococcus sp.]
MKTKIKVISLFLCVLMLSLCVVFLTGCSSNSITGMWAYVDSDGEVTTDKMYFNDDGSCNDIDISDDSGKAISYKVLDDGKLVINTDWDKTKSYDLTDDKEQAKDDSDYYYCDGDTLIFRLHEYKRVN